MTLMNAKAPVSGWAPGSQPCYSSLQTSLQHTGGHQQGEPPGWIPPTAGARGDDNTAQSAPLAQLATGSPGLSIATSSFGSVLAIAGGVWIQPGPTCPEGCSPLVPGGVSEASGWHWASGCGELRRARGAWAGAAPSQGSSATLIAYREGQEWCCLETLHFTDVSVHERETFTVLLLFKYFNASHLVSYF